MKTSCYTLITLLGSLLAAIATTAAAAGPHDDRRGDESSELVHANGPSDALQTSAAPNQRLREGSMLQDVPGKFEVTGDRITFYPRDGIDPLRTLENLALERVARELAGIPREREWRVSGMITEYQGGNYLLVQRAIMKSGPAE